MTRSRRTFPGRAARWGAELPASGWREAAGALPLLAALALWACAAAGVFAPLSDALARLDAAPRTAPAESTCGVPPGALASAPLPGEPAPCR